MEIYLSEIVIRKLIRQELCEVLEDKGVETKKDDKQKVEKTAKRLAAIKNVAAGSIAVGAIVTAININNDIAKAEAERIETIENEKMMMLSDKVDEKIQHLVDMGVLPEVAQKIVVGSVLGIDKTEKDQDKIFDKKIEVLEQIDNIDTVSLALSDIFLSDMRNQGNQVMTTIGTQQGSFGVLSTRVDQTIAGISAEVQKDLENLDVKTGVVELQVDPQKKQKLRTLTFDPLQFSYWDDKIQQGSEIENKLHNLYGEQGITIPAFMYETVAPTVASQEIASQLKENKKTRGKYV